jgi:hypothetical protein
VRVVASAVAGGRCATYRGSLAKDVRHGALTEPCWSEAAVGPWKVWWFLRRRSP